MRHRPAWAPKEIDIERPAAARMYGYLLGGSHDFAGDRELAEQASQVFPDAPCVVRANRSCPTCAVRAPCALGVDKFLDLLSDIPTAGNVHEIVARERPGAVTMYVDSDPVAVVQRLLDGYDLLEPGLVDVIRWRPDPVELGADLLGGDVARYSLRHGPSAAGGLNSLAGPNPACRFVRACRPSAAAASGCFR
jgi:hypothetical protein